MSVCISQNLEKYRVLWTDFSASCREINRFSVSKIGPEPAKPTISLALLQGDLKCSPQVLTLLLHKILEQGLKSNPPPHQRQKPLQTLMIWCHCLVSCHWLQAHQIIQVLKLNQCKVISNSPLPQKVTLRKLCPKKLLLPQYLKLKQNLPQPMFTLQTLVQLMIKLKINQAVIS